MRKSILSLLLLLGLVCICEAADLEVSIQFRKRVYRIGDQLECVIRFTNPSAAPIRFLPRDTLFPASELQFTSATTPKAATLVRLGDSFDIEALAKQVVILSPGKTLLRRL